VQQFPLFKEIMNYLLYDNIGNIVLLAIFSAIFIFGIFTILQKFKKAKNIEKKINNDEKDVKVILEQNINTTEKQETNPIQNVSNLPKSVLENIMILSTHDINLQFEVLKNKLNSTEIKIEGIFTDLKIFIEDIKNDVDYYTKLTYKNEEITKFFIKNLTLFTADKIYNILCDTFFNLFESSKEFDFYKFHSLLDEKIQDFINIFSNIILFLNDINQADKEGKVEIIKNLYTDLFINKIMDKKFEKNFFIKEGELDKNSIKFEFKKISNDFVNKLADKLLEFFNSAELKDN